MPSFRVTLTVGALAPGVSPGSVLPRAAAAAGEFTTVESSDIAVVAGQARVIVRFTGEDEELAAQIGSHVANSVSSFATVAGFNVTQRVGNRWVGVK